MSFAKTKTYNWKIDLGEAGYCEFESNADKAWEVYASLCEVFETEDLPMYCNGNLT